MNHRKKYTVLLVIPVLLVVIIFAYIFYRMGTNDAKALADFPIAYQHYDQAISDFSKAVLSSNPGTEPNTEHLELLAEEALATLKTKASIRISSLTRHDGDLMKLFHEITVLAGQELDTLKAYRSAAADKNTDIELLAKQFRELNNQRQADYASFQELGGIIK